jgi:L-rhamnose mutarotase
MRVTLHSRLRAGAEEAYEAAHRDVPAELQQAIRDAGVHDYGDEHDSLPVVWEL